MGTVTRSNKERARNVDALPFAMIGMSIAMFTQKHGLTFERDVDDFDEFRALYLDVDGHPAMLKRYDGEPSEGITIYLEAGLNEKSMDKLLNKILRKYAIS